MIGSRRYRIFFDRDLRVWGALLNGGNSGNRDHSPFRREILQGNFANRGITAMFLTSPCSARWPPKFRGFFNLADAHRAEKRSIQMPVRAVLKNQPPRRLVNGYGPTEIRLLLLRAADDVPEEALSVPIGRRSPIPRCIFLTLTEIPCRWGCRASCTQAETDWLAAIGTGRN